MNILDIVTLLETMTKDKLNCSRRESYDYKTKMSDKFSIRPRSTYIELPVEEYAHFDDVKEVYLDIKLGYSQLHRNVNLKNVQLYRIVRNGIATTNVIYRGSFLPSREEDIVWYKVADTIINKYSDYDVTKESFHAPEHLGRIKWKEMYEKNTKTD